MPLATANPGGHTAIDWPLVYLSLAAVGLIVLALYWLNISPIDDVSGLVLATIMVMVFTVVSLLYWWDFNQDCDGSNAESDKRAR